MSLRLKYVRQDLVLVFVVLCAFGLNPPVAPYDAINIYFFMSGGRRREVGGGGLKKNPVRFEC